ncbi:hypothetical protein BC827DRAFT_1373071 [Russula dissimulans]|nr:hypothetical protein BC827DRAFT_1373071 [Russula dissimulans]
MLRPKRWRRRLSLLTSRLRRNRNLCSSSPLRPPNPLRTSLSLSQLKGSPKKILPPRTPISLWLLARSGPSTFSSSMRLLGGHYNVGCACSSSVNLMRTCKW